VDDVFTTGATLAEAGAALAGGGAASVEAITFARAVEMVGQSSAQGR
jgi:predicted amidophosphoribosyltransferase